MTSTPTAETEHSLRRTRVTTLFAAALALSALCVLGASPTAAGDDEPFPIPKGSESAADWRSLHYLDENGNLPRTGLVDGKRQIDALRAESERTLNRAGWTALGPGNVGGRIRDIRFLPGSASTFWLTAASGGIWKTTNSGASWTVADDYMSNLATQTLVIDPISPNRMWVGTGEFGYGETFATQGIRQPPEVRVTGGGILRSLDGGVTWNVLPFTLTLSTFQRVFRLAVSPNGTTLLAATNSGVWRSNDGGDTWTLPATSASLACDVRFDPNNSLVALAGRANGTYQQTTDGGFTWGSAVTLNVAGGNVQMSWLRTVPGVVYASVDMGAGNDQLFRSSNSGGLFVARNTTTDYTGTQGFHAHAIWASPTDTAGAIPASAATEVVVLGAVGIFRSVDGGTTLVNIGAAPLHADQNVIVEPPDFNGTTVKTVYVGNDGGIFRTTDIFTAPAGGAAWTSLNNTLPITQFICGAEVGAAGAETLVGGTQDNGTQRRRAADGFNGYVDLQGADGGYCSCDQGDANRFYTTKQNLNIFRTANGQAAVPLVEGINTNNTDANTNSNFYAPIVLDPNNGNTLYAGGAGLWRTTNVQALPAATVSWSNLALPAGANVSYIAIQLGNSNVVWAGRNDGGLWSTANGTAALPTWTRRDTQTPALPDRFLSSITIDPANSNRVYVTFGGFTPNNLWVTTNGGTNWTALNGVTGVSELPDIPLYDVQIDPVETNTLFVGTELGVVYSLDGGANWRAPNSGPANVPVLTLIPRNNLLYAATYGRGWFVEQPVVDIVPPGVACTIGTKVLWPALRGLNDVKLRVVASDTGDPNPTRRVAVFSDETNGAAPYTPDAAVSTTPPFPPGQTFSLRCRSERLTAGNGRIYVVSTSATDVNGNVGRDACALVCPKSMTTGHLTALLLEANAAEASADGSATGTPSAPWNNAILATTVLPSP